MPRPTPDSTPLRAGHSLLLLFLIVTAFKPTSQTQETNSSNDNDETPNLQLVNNPKTSLSLANIKGKIVGPNFKFKPELWKLQISRGNEKLAIDCVLELVYQSSHSFFLVGQKDPSQKKIMAKDLVYLATQDRPLVLYQKPIYNYARGRNREIDPICIDQSLPVYKAEKVMHQFNTKPEVFDLPEGIQDDLFQTPLDHLQMLESPVDGLRLDYLQAAQLPPANIWEEAQITNEDLEFMSNDSEEVKDNVMDQFDKMKEHAKDYIQTTLRTQLQRYVEYMYPEPDFEGNKAARSEWRNEMDQDEDPLLIKKSKWNENGELENPMDICIVNSDGSPVRTTDPSQILDSDSSVVILESESTKTPILDNDPLLNNDIEMHDKEDLVVDNISTLKSNVVDQLSNVIDQISTFNDERSDIIDLRSNTIDEFSSSLEQRSNTIEQRSNIIEEFSSSLEQRSNTIEELSTVIEQNRNTIGEVSLPNTIAREEDRTPSIVLNQSESDPSKVLSIPSRFSYEEYSNRYAESYHSYSSIKTIDRQLSDNDLLRLDSSDRISDNSQKSRQSFVSTLGADLHDLDKVDPNLSRTSDLSTDMPDTEMILRLQTKSSEPKQNNAVKLSKRGKEQLLNIPAVIEQLVAYLEQIESGIDEASLTKLDKDFHKGAQKYLKDSLTKTLQDKEISYPFIVMRDMVYHQIDLETASLDWDVFNQIFIDHHNTQMIELLLAQNSGDLPKFANLGHLLGKEFAKLTLHEMNLEVIGLCSENREQPSLYDIQEELEDSMTVDFEIKLLFGSIVSKVHMAYSRVLDKYLEVYNESQVSQTYDLTDESVVKSFHILRYLAATREIEHSIWQDNVKAGVFNWELPVRLLI